MKKVKKKMSTVERARRAGSVMSEAKREQLRAAGSVTSSRKAKASRKNGMLGGRPGNPEIRRIMQQRGVSRQRAHQILKGK